MTSVEIQSVLDVLLDSADNTILAVVDAVEDCEPVIDGHRNSVELDAVDESTRCAVDTLGSGVLPEGAHVAISIVFVVLAVAACDIRLIKVELSGNLLGPPGLEVIL